MHLTTLPQVSCLCSSAGSPSSTMPISTCPGGLSLRPSTYFKYLPSCPRISSLSTSASRSSRRISSTSLCSIIVTVLAVCAARWAAVSLLSGAINWLIRYRARRQGRETSDELPYKYQAMLFWAGLRGAVGVALAALLTGKSQYALQATVLVVVVLTVIIFGGTTARMLEILDIRTGVVEEIDSDDEFDIEAIGGGSYYKRSGNGIGYEPRQRGSAVALDSVGGGNGRGDRNGWASGHRSPHTLSRDAESQPQDHEEHDDDLERSDLLGASGNTTDSRRSEAISIHPICHRRLPGGDQAPCRLARWRAMRRATSRLAEHVPAPSRKDTTCLPPQRSDSCSAPKILGTVQAAGRGLHQTYAAPRWRRRRRRQQQKWSRR